MGFPNGDIKLSSNCELNAALPWDARTKVDSIADRDAISFKYAGLISYVGADETPYICTDPAGAGVWKPLGGGDFIPLAGTAVGAPVTGEVELGVGAIIYATNETNNSTLQIVANNTTGIELNTESDFPINLKTHSGIINLQTGDVGGIINLEANDGNINLTSVLGNLNFSGVFINIIGEPRFNNKLLNLNSNGIASTGFGVGINVIENNVTTGYFKSTTDRNGWSLKSPNRTGVIAITTPVNSYTANLPNKAASSNETFAMLSDLSGLSPSLTSTRIAFGSSSNVITESADLTWDDISKTLQLNDGFRVKWDDLYNIVIGKDAFLNNEIAEEGGGYSNIAVGYQALALNVTGYNNIAIGQSSLNQSQGGVENVAIGYQALFSSINCSASTAIGFGALVNNINSIKNTAIGHRALALNTTGSNNIAIGVEAHTTNNSASNQLVIGSSFSPIHNIYFGSGGGDETISYTQPNVNFHLTPSKGLNQAGGSYIINGGQSTGSGIGGSVIFATSSASASSSTVNSLVNRVIVDQLGNVTLRGQREFRFNNSANTFYTSLKTGNNTSNLDLTLPIADGTNGQVLATNGSGVLSFITISSGGGGTITSVSGTTNRITSTGGTTPIIDISSAYVGQASITTLGTVTTGTWNGTAIADTYISSASVWNGKQNALNGTGLVRMTGTTVSYDNTTYLTANQTITLSGIVTGSGTTAITTSIANGVISNAMLANSAVANLSGTNTGDNAVNSLYSGLVSNATHTGDVTGATTLTISNSVVTYAKIQNVTTARLMGRITTGSGVMEELTGTQATTLLDNFTTSLKGVVPASGGGTTNFLRADGTWAAPSGGITGTGASGQVSFWNGTSTQTGSNNLFWDNSNERLGIGVNSPLAKLQISADGSAVSSSLISDQFAITNTNAPLGFTGIVAGSTQFNRTVYKGIRTRGTLSSPTACIAEDYTLSFLGLGHDGTNNIGSAAIEFIVDGSVGTGSVPQRIVFATGVNARNERLSIRNDGVIVVGPSTSSYSNAFLQPGTGSVNHIIRAIASQTADLTQWQNSSGTVLSKFTATGRLGLGLGATAPDAILHIKETGANVPLIIERPNTGVNMLECKNGSTIVARINDAGSAIFQGTIRTEALSGSSKRVVEANGLGTLVATTRLSRSLFITTTRLTYTGGSETDYHTPVVPANTLEVNGDKAIYTFTYGAGTGAGTVNGYVYFGGTKVADFVTLTDGSYNETIRVIVTRLSSSTAYAQAIREGSFGSFKNSYTELTGLDFTSSIVFKSTLAQAGSLEALGIIGELEFKPAP